MKTEDLAVYKVVCERIGAESATIELDKIILISDHCRLITNEGDILNAFLWDKTPQGRSFWSKICFGDA